MSANFDLELTAEALERAAEGLRRYRAIIARYFGDTPEEVRETIEAVEGLHPAQIREACRLFRRVTGVER